MLNTSTNPKREKWIADRVKEKRADYAAWVQEQRDIFGDIPQRELNSWAGEFEAHLEEWIRDRRDGIPEY